MPGKLTMICLARCDANSGSTFQNRHTFQTNNTIDMNAVSQRSSGNAITIPKVTAAIYTDVVDILKILLGHIRE